MSVKIYSLLSRALTGRPCPAVTARPGSRGETADGRSVSGRNQDKRGPYRAQPKFSSGTNRPDLTRLRLPKRPGLTVRPSLKAGAGRRQEPLSRGGETGLLSAKKEAGYAA